MFTQKFIKIFHLVQEIGPFSLLRIWHSPKPRPMINVILQFLGLDLFNIKLSAKFYQNIPNGLIVNFHIFFRLWTSAKPRPIPNVIWQSHGLRLVNVPMCMQNFITLFHSVQEVGPFSLFQNLALGKASTDDKCHFAIPWARSFQYQIVCKILSKYSKRFNS